MSEFDFLSSVTIGQYIPKDSPIHWLDPRSKLAGTFAFLLALTFTRSTAGLLLGIAFLFIGLICAKISIRHALKGLLAPLPFLLIIALIQILFYQPRGVGVLWSFGVIQISRAGLLSGLNLMLRFAALILLFSLVSFTVSTSEMISGLQQLLNPLNKLGLRTMDFVMAVQIALRFLPMLAQTSERIAKAQASRGADWGGRGQSLIKRMKQRLPLMIPLFTISLKRAETMAMAMDARAYGYQPNRTSLYEYHFSKRDGLFLVMVLCCCLAVVLL